MKKVFAPRVLFAAALICGGGIFSTSGATEPGKMLNVFTRTENGITHLYVQNPQLASVTATFQLQASNLQPSAKFPFTTTLAANETIDAFTLAPIKRNTPWDFSLTRSSLLGSASAVHDDSCVYLLPYAVGSSFPVSQGYHGHFSHTGPDEFAIDWQMPVGTPVHAARGGLVVEAKDDSNLGGPNRKFESDANRILIQHADGTIGIYGHLQKNGNHVKAGDRVEAGDFIGLSGNTGFSNGPHLHFAVFKTRDGLQRVSLPVKFRTTENSSLTLQSGKTYTAAPLPPASPVLVSSIR